MKAIEKYLHNYLACVCMLCMLNKGLFLIPHTLRTDREVESVELSGNKT